MAIYALYQLALKLSFNTGKPEFASQNNKLEFAGAGVSSELKPYNPFT
jgi:hypothetical protein